MCDVVPHTSHAGASLARDGGTYSHRDMTWYKNRYSCWRTSCEVLVLLSLTKCLTIFQCSIHKLLLLCGFPIATCVDDVMLSYGY